jgi:hypothetical protein
MRAGHTYSSADGRKIVTRIPEEVIFRQPQNRVLTEPDEEQYTFPENSTLQKDKGFQGYEPENVITYQPKKATQRHTLDRR